MTSRLSETVIPDAPGDDPSEGRTPPAGMVAARAQAEETAKNAPAPSVPEQAPVPAELFLPPTQQDPANAPGARTADTVYPPAPGAPSPLVAGAGRSGGPPTPLPLPPGSGPNLASTPEVPPERFVLGPFRIQELLAEGGMGRVYLAEHEKLGRKVAIKVLRSEYSNRPDVVQRFFAEARAVNQICHDNIIAITDFVEHSSAGAYYVMELLTGHELTDEVEGGTPLDLGRALHIAVQVADALAAAHACGVVHRDLKPGNIFLTKHRGDDDFVKILDFGVAKLSDDENNKVGLSKTAPGSFIGTPQYMSPEQLNGEPTDFHADIYAFGLVLYEMITGVQPFPGSSIGELAIKHLTVKPKPPSKQPLLPHTIPPELDKLVLHCLAKAPEDRPSSMEEVAARLREILSWAAPTLYDGSVPTLPVRPPASRTPLVLMAAVALVVVAGLFVLLRPQGETLADPGAPVAGDPAAATGNPGATSDPAPVEPPPVEAPPPGPATVELLSEPPGAKVTRTDTKEVLGKTPLTVTFPEGTTSMDVEMSLRGHFASDLTLTPDVDRVVAPLVKRTRGSRDPRKAADGKPADEPRKPKKKVHKDAVLNPYD